MVCVRHWDLTLRTSLPMVGMRTLSILRRKPRDQGFVKHDSPQETCSSYTLPLTPPQCSVVHHTTPDDIGSMGSPPWEEACALGVMGPGQIYTT